MRTRKGRCDTYLKKSTHHCFVGVGELLNQMFTCLEGHGVESGMFRGKILNLHAFSRRIHPLYCLHINQIDDTIQNALRERYEFFVP